MILLELWVLFCEGYCYKLCMDWLVRQESTVLHLGVGRFGLPAWKQSEAHAPSTIFPSLCKRPSLSPCVLDVLSLLPCRSLKGDLHRRIASSNELDSHLPVLPRNSPPLLLIHVRIQELDLDVQMPETRKLM
jgi:hypothetical protein